MSFSANLAGDLDAVPDSELDGEIIAMALENAETPEQAYKVIMGCTNAGARLAAEIVGRKFQGWAGDVILPA